MSDLGRRIRGGPSRRPAFRGHEDTRSARRRRGGARDRSFRGGAQAPGHAGRDRRGGGPKVLAGSRSTAIELEPVPGVIGSPTAREPLDNEQSPAGFCPQAGTYRARDGQGSRRTGSIVHDDPKTHSGPLRRDVHVLMGLQTRMLDAVPDELRYQQPGVVQYVGRDHEGAERSADLRDRARDGTDAEIQSPSRPHLPRNTVRAHAHGLPDRRAVHAPAHSSVTLTSGQTCRAAPRRVARRSS